MAVEYFLHSGRHERRTDTIYIQIGSAV
jgi:hypothetical protein